MHSEDLVLVEYVTDAIAILRLNRLEKRNALSNVMLCQLAAYIRQLENTKGMRCIILTGGDKAFCAGSDIKEFAEYGIDAIHNPSRMQAWSYIENTHIPMIASVSGICMGAGHELAMLCDIVVADTDAIFAQPEIKLGHIPGDGATQRLPRLIGKYRAMQMILTGRPITGQQAYDMGLLSQVTPVGQAEKMAVTIAKQVAEHSLRALSLAKDAVKASQNLSLNDGLVKEQHNINEAFTTKDQQEGLSAFLEKRQPNFTDE